MTNKESIEIINSLKDKLSLKSNEEVFDFLSALKNTFKPQEINYGLPIPLEKLMDALGVSRTAIYNWITEGIITPQYIAGFKRPFFFPSEILKCFTPEERILRKRNIN